MDGREVEATLGKQVRQEDVEVLSVLDPSGTQVGTYVSRGQVVHSYIVSLPFSHFMSLDTFFYAKFLQPVWSCDTAQWSKPNFQHKGSTKTLKSQFLMGFSCGACLFVRYKNHPQKVHPSFSSQQVK